MLAAAGVHVVVGTSGLDTAAVDTIRAATADDGSGDGGGDGDGGRSGGHVAIVPNFAISAVLMQRFAELAAPHFDRVEIIEFHHDGKADAPSGTAVATAERIAAARARPADPTVQRRSPAQCRRPAGIPIHAVRMRMNHIRGDPRRQGQTLTLRQDSFDHQLRPRCAARRPPHPRVPASPSASTPSCSPTGPMWPELPALIRGASGVSG